MKQTNPTYKPVTESDQIMCGTGTVVAVTGWTPISAVTKHLEPHEFAAIGNLYSPTRGINLLVRGLLANPHARFLVMLDATKADKNSGAIECLLWFLHYGFEKGLTDLGKEAWIINCNWQPDSSFTYQGKGYIDIEIPEDVLNNLRNNIKWVSVSKVKDCINEIWSLGKKSSQPWGDPKIYPMSEIATKVFPGRLYGHRVEGRTIAETWVKIIHRIKTTGTLRPTGYGGQWQELIDLMAVITDEPSGLFFPNPNYLPYDKDFIEEYISQILDDSEYREGVKYTYGQRMRSWFGCDQIQEVVDKLIAEIDSASAVINLWDSGGNINRRLGGTSDRQHNGSPCLNHIWVRVVGSELSLTATLRSNDMFAAWPANAMGLRALQKHICDAINKSPRYQGDRLILGPLITHSLSAHIYDNCWDYAEKLIADRYVGDRPKFSDPAGNFLIRVAEDSSGIEVTHTSPTPGDEILQEFRGTNSTEIGGAIVAACPDLEPSHLLYLGVELHRAYIALVGGTKYYQG